MEPSNVQAMFFQQIRNLLPPHLSIVDEIAGVLNISTDSAYRRIRGEKPISFDDIQALCNKYRISIDQFLQKQHNGFIFTGSLGYDSTGFVERYPNDMLQQFDFVKGFDEKHIYFLPNDIPPFAYLQIPELAAFTFFYYQKSLLHFEELIDLKFSVKDIDRNQAILGYKVQAAFNQIPSTEIWSSDTINSLLRHISFYRDTNMFSSKDDLVCLYEKMYELIAHLEKQAETGLKFNHRELPGKDSASFNLYLNDLISGDNCVLATIGEERVTYISHNLINSMFTRNQAFTNYTFETLKNAMRKSTQISVVGEKTRAKFFDLLRQKINAQRKI